MARLNSDREESMKPIEENLDLPEIKIDPNKMCHIEKGCPINNIHIILIAILLILLFIIKLYR